LKRENLGGRQARIAETQAVSMKIEIRNRCSDFNSYRAARVKSLFGAQL
jgi:hypothetical protein